MTAAPPTPHTESQMLVDLNTTFPQLRARPLGELPEGYTNPGLWTTQGAATMPDGWPFFVWYGDATMPLLGRIHNAFAAWLHQRGWRAETNDGRMHHLIPIPEFVAQHAAADPVRAGEKQ